MNLHERILADIDGATSQQPASAMAVYRGMNEISVEAFDAAVVELETMRRICSCQITRGGRTWKVIWPTGVIVPSAGWTGASMSHLYQPQTPRRLPHSPQQRHQEPTMKYPNIDERTDALRRAIAGTDESTAVSVVQVAKQIGIDTRPATALMKSAVKKLVDAGEAIAIDKRGLNGHKTLHLCARKATTDGESLSVSAHIHHDIQGIETGPLREPPKSADTDLHLCIYDDARLVIEQGGARMELAPAATRKLVRFVVAMEGVAAQ